MANTIIEIQEILQFYFKVGHKSTKAACRIQEVEGKETISDHTVKNFFMDGC